MPSSTTLSYPHSALETLQRAHHVDARGANFNAVNGNQNITVNTVNNHFHFYINVNSSSSSLNQGHATQAIGRPSHSTSLLSHAQPTSQQTLPDPTSTAQKSEKPRGIFKSTGHQFFRSLKRLFSLCGAILVSSRQRRGSGEADTLDGSRQSIPLNVIANPGYGPGAATPVTSDFPYESGEIGMPEPITFPSPEVYHYPALPSRAHTLSFPTPILQQSAAPAASGGTATPASTTLQRSATDSLVRLAHLSFSVPQQI
ncbi:hypothetical protein K435DRAFT_858289 [Dendrothele bispora CBS 962.96]|uniref:Uncharacterized protein n=1 Tax=Dendrothele bispora (strain CBS 962.96) TaxID=1314807 RepID=A0A4S8M3L3_DENBC|nr:hypothetical protein K435DRAFT_858289 [Dendrothele bispora CBS 962.96]